LHGKLPWKEVAGLLSTGVSNMENKGIRVTQEDVSKFGSFPVRRSLSEEARSLLARLLHLDKSVRLGCNGRGQSHRLISYHMVPNF
jgi:hypothetical protein